MYTWLFGLPIMASLLTSYYAKRICLCSSKMSVSCHSLETYYTLIYFFLLDIPFPPDQIRTLMILFLLCEPSLNPHYVTLSRNKLPDEIPGQWDWNLSHSQTQELAQRTAYAKQTLRTLTPSCLSNRPLCSFFHESLDPWKRSAFPADSQGSADNAIVHSTSDPIMTARRDATSRISSPNQPPQVQCPYLSDEIVFSSKSCTCWQKWKNRQQERFPPGQSMASYPLEVCIHEIPLCP